VTSPLTSPYYVAGAMDSAERGAAVVESVKNFKQSAS